LEFSFSYLEYLTPITEHRYKPLLDSDIFDEYYVDMKSFSIDISDFLRQEIILHFPSNLVCSTGCKGLCGFCGKDLNKGKCDCVPPEEEKKESPLSKLKELIK
jgi:uncharacterized protein